MTDTPVDRRIFAQLTRIATALDRVERRTLALVVVHGQPLGEDLVIRNDPPGWNGMSFAGDKMSACPAGYLDRYAANLRAFAKKNEGSLLKAARAREVANLAEAWASVQRRHDETSSRVPPYGGR